MHCWDDALQPFRPEAANEAIYTSCLYFMYVLCSGGGICSVSGASQALSSCDAAAASHLLVCWDSHAQGVLHTTELKPELVPDKKLV
jgi:hypothetical protein